MSEENKIVKAQQFYLAMQATDNIPQLERYREVLNRSLQEAGADHSALDPKGERNSDELRAEVDGMVSKQYVIKAQQFFYALDTERDPSQARKYSNLIDDNLKKAGQNYSALDAAGERGERAMKMQVERAVARVEARSPEGGRGR